MVQTRRQGKEVEKEGQKEIEEKGELKELTKTQEWLLGVKRKFQVSGGRCLVDPNYTCRTRITLSEEEYRNAVSKHYLFGQLFRFLGWVCMLDMARAKERYKGTPEEPDLMEGDIRKEGIGLLFRTSQRHWEVSKWTETKVDEIGCLLLRLEKEVANSIYGTLNIPVLNHKDPLTAKLIRNSHLMTRDISRGVHNLTKTTLANLVKGEVAAYWKG